MLCHRSTRDAAPLLIYVDALFLGLVNLGKIELDGMTKVIALWRQGWWPDQGCRLLGMGLVLILSNDIQPRDAILAPIKTTKIATPMAGSITRPLALRIDVLPQKGRL
jgi:hypothetical protein